MSDYLHSAFLAHPLQLLKPHPLVVFAMSINSSLQCRHSRLYLWFGMRLPFLLCGFKLAQPGQPSAFLTMSRKAVTSVSYGVVAALQIL